MSLFYTAFDRRFIEVREIEKMRRKAVDSNELFIDGLEVPVEDRIGEDGRGFEYILHGLNPERILIAAEAVRLGRATQRRTTDYAKQRIVFGRPIGKDQAIQHPLLVHGSYGYAREYHVKRDLSEMMIPRIAPVSPHLILRFIAGKSWDCRNPIEQADKDTGR